MSVTSVLTRCTRLLGFWQLMIAGTVHLALLEQDVDGRVTTLSLFRSSGEGWPRVFTHEEEDLWVKAADGVASFEDLVFCFETNRGQSLQITHLNLRALRGGPVDFRLIRSVTLNPARAARVKLPVSRMWHTLGPPDPEASLFSPSFVREEPGNHLLVANTADGQAIVLGSDDSDTLSYARALEPEASRTPDGDLLIVFRRPSRDFFPYQLHERYSGSPSPLPGDLILGDQMGFEENLSAQLQIGAVIAQTIRPGADRVPRLFVVREEAVGTSAVLLEDDLGWSIRDRLSFREEIERIDAIWDDDAWSLVLAHRVADGWELFHRRWKP